MKKRSSSPEDWEQLREQILGLGERSIRKSYYPELQQRLSELERFRLLLEHTHDPILIFNMESNSLVDANLSARQQFELQAAKLTEYTMATTFPQSMLKPIQDWLAEKKQTETGWFSFSATISMSNGTSRDTENELGLMEIRGNRYGIITSRDVTAHNQAEAQLAQLARVVEQMAEAVVVTDHNGDIVYVNPAFERLTGYSQEEVHGQNPRILKSGRQHAAFYEELWKTITAGHVWTGQFVNKRKDGTLYTEDATIAPLKDASGRIAHYVAVKRDVTKEIELEKRFMQAQKMEAIGTLAGGIAHDFNNILSAILGHADLALYDLPETSEAHACLMEVVQAGNRAKELVGQILAFSRKTERERRPLRIQAVVTEALKLLRASIPPTIEIRHRINDSCAPVIADATEIHQIVMNLCTNAYQAMRDKGGILEVELAQVHISETEAQFDVDLHKGEYIRLAVSDTGHGMDQTVLPRIFDPYFTTKMRGEGTGLGLATVHGIVRSYAGAIHVYSVPNEGTTFVILFPVSAATVEGNTTSPPPIELLRGTERILIVDDEEAIGNFCKVALERLGYSVTLKTSPKDALETFQKNPYEYDILVTDQMMPHLRGTELSHEIKSIRADIPIILCSGFGDIIHDMHIKDAGIQEYLMKPIIASDLASAIRKLLEHSDLLDSV